MVFQNTLTGELVCVLCGHELVRKAWFVYVYKNTRHSRFISLAIRMAFRFTNFTPIFEQMKINKQISKDYKKVNMKEKPGNNATFSRLISVRS